MEWVKDLLQKVTLREVLRRVEKDPGQGVMRLIKMVKPFVTDPWHKEVVLRAEQGWADSETSWRRLVERGFAQLSPNTIEKFVNNFLINSAVIGNAKTHEISAKYDRNVPWAILMDPTSDCNLKCVGCWAEEYAKGANLTYDELDDIINQGKELGIYMYFYSGGEPLIRADDIIKLAEKHNDCMFCAFTNATLVTPGLAETLGELGNVALAVSVEGFSDVNDFRRGKGNYERVARSMDLLREAGVLFGFSACYHRQNTEAAASEEFIDAMIEKGCMFGWYFTYVPLGRNADPNLLVTPEQRRLMYEKVRKYRSSKDLFVIDFWNDGEYVNGCIAGGRRYLHINAHGDVEPCAFIHYSNVNIREVSLLDALASPLFMQYRKEHPFNENPLRPCPLLDNPDALRAMVNTAAAYSTQQGDNEAVEVLTDKCVLAAKQWAPVADQLWYEKDQERVGAAQ